MTFEISIFKAQKYFEENSALNLEMYALKLENFYFDSRRRI